MGGGDEGEAGGSGFRVTWTGGMAEALGANYSLGDGGLGSGAAAAGYVVSGTSHGFRAVAVDNAEAERAYRCMRWVCGAVWKEVHRDIQIHNVHLFPR